MKSCPSHVVVPTAKGQWRSRRFWLAPNVRGQTVASRSRCPSFCSVKHATSGRTDSSRDLRVWHCGFTYQLGSDSTTDLGRNYSTRQLGLRVTLAASARHFRLARSRPFFGTVTIGPIHGWFIPATKPVVFVFRLARPAVDPVAGKPPRMNVEHDTRAHEEHRKKPDATEISRDQHSNAE